MFLLTSWIVYFTASPWTFWRYWQAIILASNLLPSKLDIFLPLCVCFCSFCYSWLPLSILLPFIWSLTALGKVSFRPLHTEPQNALMEQFRELSACSSDSYLLPAFHGLTELTSFYRVRSQGCHFMSWVDWNLDTFLLSMFSVFLVFMLTRHHCPCGWYWCVPFHCIDHACFRDSGSAGAEYRNLQVSDRVVMIWAPKRGVGICSLNPFLSSSFRQGMCIPHLCSSTFTLKEQTWLIPTRQHFFCALINVSKLHKHENCCTVLLCNFTCISLSLTWVALTT